MKHYRTEGNAAVSPEERMVREMHERNTVINY